MKYGIIVTDNRVAKKRSSYTNTRRWPFFAHIPIFGLFPSDEIPGRSLFRAIAFSAVLPNFYGTTIAVFSVTHSNVYHIARTRQKASENIEVHRSLQNCASSFWNWLLVLLPPMGPAFGRNSV